jgi:uncharacterized protein YegP (UPF0339 family)
MAKKTPTIEVFSNDQRDHFWRLRGRNGEILATSEAYNARSSALRAAKRVKDIVAEAEIVA